MVPLIHFHSVMQGNLQYSLWKHPVLDWFVATFWVLFHFDLFHRSLFSILSLVKIHFVETTVHHSDIFPYISASVTQTYAAKVQATFLFLLTLIL